ncbi:Cardiolipin synthase N-terminal domain-containing protein [Madurella fahalii]|uniref:Cardiolipin synthase N-terminal domain-containing protein n=1 Tax=Madurella fahalii TaxID=1157608 RepID=A0ABQ0GG79_9PEZI
MIHDAILLSFLLQLCLATLGLAAPVQSEALSNSWQYGTGGGLLGLVVLILDVIVFVEVLKSSRPPVQKLIWCLVVFLFPILGMIIYYLFSNRSDYQRGSGYEALT